MKNICVFGASITSGLNDLKEGGWCDLLKRNLLSRGGFTFNLGVSGEDSSDLLKRINGECNVRNPDVIIIALGGNDSQFLMEKNKFRIDSTELKTNFEGIIEKAKRHTKNIVIIGLTKVDEEKINSVFIPDKKKYYKNETLKEYNNTIEKIASDQNLKFIEVFDIVAEEDLDDGLHPNPKGHNQLFKKIKEELGDFL